MERFELSRAVTHLPHFECGPFNHLGTSPDSFAFIGYPFSLDLSRESRGCSPTSAATFLQKPLRKRKNYCIIWGAMIQQRLLPKQRPLPARSFFPMAQRRSHATHRCEPCQAGNRAALSRCLWVPWPTGPAPWKRASEEHPGRPKLYFLYHKKRSDGHGTAFGTIPQVETPDL